MTEISRKQFLRGIIERDPTNPANFSLARRLRDELDFDEAIRVLEKWIESKPEPPRSAMAESELRNVKYYKEEIERNEAILAKNPSDYTAVKALAMTYAEYLFHDERALHYLEKAYELNPEDKDVMFWLVHYRDEVGDTEGADEIDRKLHAIEEKSKRP